MGKVIGSVTTVQLSHLLATLTKTFCLQEVPRSCQVLASRPDHFEDRSHSKRAEQKTKKPLLQTVATVLRKPACGGQSLACWDFKRSPQSCWCLVDICAHLFTHDWVSSFRLIWMLIPSWCWEQWASKWTGEVGINKVRVTYANSSSSLKEYLPWPGSYRVLPWVGPLSGIATNLCRETIYFGSWFQKFYSMINLHCLLSFCK